MKLYNSRTVPRIYKNRVYEFKEGQPEYVYFDMPPLVFRFKIVYQNDELNFYEDWGDPDAMNETVIHIVKNHIIRKFNKQKNKDLPLFSETFKFVEDVKTRIKTRLELRRKYLKSQKEKKKLRIQNQKAVLRKKIKLFDDKLNNFILEFKDFYKKNIKKLEKNYKFKIETKTLKYEKRINGYKEYVKNKKYILKKDSYVRMFKHFEMKYKIQLKKEKELFEKRIKEQKLALKNKIKNKKLSFEINNQKIKTKIKNVM